MKLDQSEFPVETDKPCPFCASKNLRCEERDIGEGWVCWCANCGAFGPNDLGWSGAIESWNMRRPQDTLVQALEEIAMGEGAYSQDRLTHAENVIENLMNIASKAIEEIEK